MRNSYQRGVREWEKYRNETEQNKKINLPI